MTLTELHTLNTEQLQKELAKCCGSVTWQRKIIAEFPVVSKEELMKKAEEKWQECNEADWLEAFSHHPKIGDINSLKEKFASTAAWANNEQSSVSQATLEVLESLAIHNRLYEEKFGYIFIICATGKSAEYMLEQLKSRLLHAPEEEILNAAEEQNKITKIRLEKLLHQ